MLVAFITGITGQDGSFLAEFLLKKEYRVYGLIRRSSIINTERIEHIFYHPKLRLIYGDMTDAININSVLHDIVVENPEMSVLEIYNLAAQSHVQVSFQIPKYTAEVDAIGTLTILDAIRKNRLESIARFYQASTSELYGKVQEIPQSETTPFYPRSPYGVAKLYGFWIVVNYRESYNLFACSGILFNHESERRGHNFVTRKITLGLKKILNGETDRLLIGNLDSLRDWGYAPEYVEGMWLMLQQPVAKDYVLATGEMHTVREFIEIAFGLRGFKISWKGKGLKEIGYDEHTGRELIFIDERYFRPCEVDLLQGDSRLAQRELGWSPKTSFIELVNRMVEYDVPGHPLSPI